MLYAYRNSPCLMYSVVLEMTGCAQLLPSPALGIVNELIIFWPVEVGSTSETNLSMLKV